MTRKPTTEKDALRRLIDAAKIVIAKQEVPLERTSTPTEREREVDAEPERN